MGGRGQDYKPLKYESPDVQQRSADSHAMRRRLAFGAPSDAPAPSGAGILNRIDPGRRSSGASARSPSGGTTVLDSVMRRSSPFAQQSNWLGTRAKRPSHAEDSEDRSRPSRRFSCAMPGVAHAAEGFYDRDSATMSVGSNTSASSPSSTVALVDGARVADPMELSGTFASDLRRRLTYETPIVVEKGTGLPLNPRGRTGLKGRGDLDMWGSNHRADPLITRCDPKTNNLQIAMCARPPAPAERLEEGSQVHRPSAATAILGLHLPFGHGEDVDYGLPRWALPGGAVDKPGSVLSDALRQALLRDVLAYGKGE